MLKLRRDTVHVWYLDASALVKLVVDEGDHQPLREFYSSHIGCHATPICLAEALGVVKGKWRRNLLTEDEYMLATRKLVTETWSKRITPDGVDLFTPGGLKAVEAIARKHHLDFADALQLETLVNGTFRFFASDSQPILVTADQALADAARKEGFRAWNCSCEPTPVET